MTTTLSRMMKKVATSSVIQLANRTPHRNYTSALFPTPLKTSSTTSNSITNLIRTTSIPGHHPFSVLAETEKRLNSDKFHQFAEAPRDFPFKIVDYAGEKFITLTREYPGEEIKVKVHGPNLHRDMCGYEEGDDEDGDKQYVYLNVSISKKSGQRLEFNVAAYEDAIETNDNLEIKNPNASRDYPTYEEPFFSDLSEKLQKAFHTYLEVRGFEPSIGKILCEYMAKKKHMKCTMNISKQLSRVEKASMSDDDFLRVIESEIVFAEEKLHKFAEAPPEFPFKIKDRAKKLPSNKIMKLTREYQGEKIKVAVHDVSYYFFPTNSGRVYVNLIGTVSSESGLNLEFDVMADSENGIKINSFNVKNANASDKDNAPDFDEKVARKYLEVRGIEPGITNILRDCMVKRKHKIYTAWLKHFKNFIAN